MAVQTLCIFLLAASLTTMAVPQNGRLDPSAEAIPVCTVFENASAYDGKEITVRGLYYRVIHGSILRGSTCDGKANMRQSREWKANRRAAKLLNSQARDNDATGIVLRGTFRMAKKGQCFGQTCSPYEIEGHELLSAEAPSK
jgi:hypothetical protein